MIQSITLYHGYTEHFNIPVIQSKIDKLNHIIDTISHAIVNNNSSQPSLGMLSGSLEVVKAQQEIAKLEKELADGKNTWDDFHILATERPVFNPPNPKTSYIDIPGGNGSLDMSESLTGYPVYENRTGSFRFRVMNDYYDQRRTELYKKEWAKHYSEIMKYLHGQSMKAILADDPEWFYKGRFSVKEWKSGNTWSEISIDYNVDPYKWRAISSTEDWLWDTFNFETGIITQRTFDKITIDSPNSFKTFHFNSALFGDAPISPKVIVSDESNNGVGITIEFYNSYLGINKTLIFKEGTTYAPDIVFYGQEDEYTMNIKGEGTISFDFRIGRL